MHFAIVSNAQCLIPDSIFANLCGASVPGPDRSTTPTFRTGNTHTRQASKFVSPSKSEGTRRCITARPTARVVAAGGFMQAISGHNQARNWCPCLIGQQTACPQNNPPESQKLHFPAHSKLAKRASPLHAIVYPSTKHPSPTPSISAQAWKHRETPKWVLAS